MATKTEITDFFCDPCERFFKSAAGLAGHNRSIHAELEPEPKPEPEPAQKVQRDPETLRAIPQTVKMQQLAIDEHGISVPRAILRTWWLFMFWLIGPLFSMATLPVITQPGPHIVVNAIAILLPLPLFLVMWSRRFMPVLRLELNDAGDRYQLRVFYAVKADLGAEGRQEIFGARGYAIDGLEEQDRALEVAAPAAELVTTTPEGLRYLCDHTPSEEKYRRKNSRLARDVIQWGALTLLVGILVGVTYIIGNSILTDPPTG